MPFEMSKIPELGLAKSTSINEARERFLLCAESGMFRHAINETYEGFGNSFVDLLEVHQALGNKTLDPGLLLAINAHLWGAVFPLLKFGDDEQKREWLPPLLNGGLIGGHAITEPQAGSDVQGIKTAAAKTADGYLLNGHKRYITNTPLAGVLVIYAKMNNTSSISAFLVMSDDAGADFQQGPVVKGCATATMGDILLSDCKIPKERLLGKAGAGATMVQLALELERAFIFAGIVGVMNWQLRKVIDYARTRPSGAETLSDVQVIAHKIADMKLRLETTSLWLRHCAELCDAGKRITLASAQTKLYASEAFLQSTLDSAHIMGAAGLEENLPILVQDAMAGRLLSGSSEIQKNIIAAMLGLSGKH